MQERDCHFAGVSPRHAKAPCSVVYSREIKTPLCLSVGRETLAGCRDNCIMTMVKRKQLAREAIAGFQSTKQERRKSCSALAVDSVKHVHIKAKAIDNSQLHWWKSQLDAEQFIFNASPHQAKTADRAAARGRCSLQLRELGWHNSLVETSHSSTSPWATSRSFLLWGWSNTGTACSERLRSFHWRYSKPHQPLDLGKLP